MTTVTPQGDACTALDGIFPAWLVPLLLDSTVPTNQLALLFALDRLVGRAQAEHPDRPVYLQQRDVAFHANLDRKTIFVTRDGDGRTLIERCRDHGLTYTPGSNDRLLVRRGHRVGEAGTYEWSSARLLAVPRPPFNDKCQISSTDSSTGVVVDCDLVSVGETPTSLVIDTSTDTTRDCGGNLAPPEPDHVDVEGLAALVNPGSLIWESKQGGLNAWRVACALLATSEPGPIPINPRQAAEMLGLGVRSGSRVLLRLEKQHNLARREGTGWVFDTSKLLRTRRQYIEDYRRDVLLGPGERPARRDHGTPMDNAAKSREYVRQHQDGWTNTRRVRPSTYFMERREALIVAARTCQADAQWLACIYGLTDETVDAYLNPKGVRQRSLKEHLTASDGPAVEIPPQPPEKAVLGRLRAMSDRVNGRPAFEVTAQVVDSSLAQCGVPEADGA